MYSTSNGVRDFYAPRKVIIKRQPSSVSPIDQNNYNVDNISVDSYDRFPSPRQNIVSKCVSSYAQFLLNSWYCLDNAVDY